MMETRIIPLQNERRVLKNMIPANRGKILQKCSVSSKLSGSLPQNLH